MIAFTLYLTLGTALAQDPAPAPAPASAPAPAPELAPASEVPPAPAPQLAPAPEPAAAPAANVESFGVADVPPAEPPPAKPRKFVFAFLPGLTAGISPLPSINLAFFFGGRLPRSPWALGYQFTFSSGYAERYGEGIMTHRHHLTAMRAFGARERGFASVGGGVAVLAVYPVVEAETRVGLRFGPRRRGIVAALVRLGWNVAFREQAPMPQFGIVAGVALF